MKQYKRDDFFEKNQVIIIIFLLSIFAIQVLYAIFTYSSTGDELPHINAGYKHLRTGEFDIDIEHPPLLALQAVPFFQHDFPLPKSMYDNLYGKFYDALLNQARMITLIYGVLLGFFVFLWAKEIFGLRAGLLALFLYSFEPNIIAHSSLVTTDLPVTCFIFISTYFFYKFLKKASWKNATIAGFFLGIALIAKFTALLLLPSFIILGIIYCWKKEKTRYLGLSLIILFIAFFIVNAAYLFKGTFNTVDSYDFDSKISKNTPLKNLPIPLPSSYVQGINYVNNHLKGHNHPAYLFGEFSWQGWWYYFFVAFLLKTPIPLILLILFSIIVLAKNFKREMIFIIIPVLVLFSISSYNHLNIGLRHILPIYPFLIVLASSCVLLIQNNSRKTLLFFLMIWLLISALFVTPHYLSYFNELIGEQKYAYQYLIDSNLEWGQTQKTIDKYIRNSAIPIKKNPECEYTPGRVAIDANSLVDFWDQKTECHSWLRSITPINRIGGFIIFDVPERD